MTSSDPDFCDECEVSLDLHPWPEEEDPAERGCPVAEQKADILSRWPL